MLTDIPIFYRLAGLSLLLLLSSCTSLPDNSHRSQSFAYTDTRNSSYGAAVQQAKSAHPGQSAFLLLDDGLDAYVARTILARSAERSIDVQYYMIHDDLVGNLFIHELLKAADRGIRIRLLVDDIGLQDLSFKTSTLDAHDNIEVRIFNPFYRNMPRILQFITRFGSVTRRMHNKSFTVDNHAGILGGRNIGNEYFDADPDLAFSDLDVVTIGPVVKEISESFDLYWNHQLAYPATLLSSSPPSEKEIALAREKIDVFVARQQNSDYAKALADSEMAKNYTSGRTKFTWGDAVIVADNPDKFIADRSETQLFLSSDLGLFFKNIKQELIIFSPYFVPGRAGAEGLINLRKRGVRIRILTNSLASTDVTAVHAGYSRYRRRLLRAGIELYEMNNTLTKKQRKEKKGPGGSSKASLHAKSFIFDRNKVFIGSFNLDPRSHTENSEIGMIMSSPEIANSMSEWFDQNIDKVAFRLELQRHSNGGEQIIWHGIKDGEMHTYSREPNVGPLRKAGVALLRMLPIEAQL
ncbi:MAG: phospholipase D family protein [Pseudomonadota bacterium]|nr:phospholipase D family protein [Pseudomonadota bacterium]